jgi:FkbM family methyltransferase
MLISLDELVAKYGIQFRGILHVGAHECEELAAYERYISRNKILWIEGLEDKVNWAKQNIPGVLIEHAVVSDVSETVTFHRSNNGQSSSILELGLHKYFHPSIHYVSSETVQTKPLRDIIGKYDISYNFLNLDIQGAELKALKGMSEYLPSVDYIYTEVNSDYVYEGCAIVTEIDEYLKQFGFDRVETNFTHCRWGDALYVRR